ADADDVEAQFGEDLAHQLDHGCPPVLFRAMFAQASRTLTTAAALGEHRPPGIDSEHLGTRGADVDAESGATRRSAHPFGPMALSGTIATLVPAPDAAN